MVSYGQRGCCSPRVRSFVVQGGLGWTAAAATSFGLAYLPGTPAKAYTDYFRSGYPSYYSADPYSEERRSAPRPQVSRQRTIEAKNATAKVEAPKPAGPLTISVSIGSQHVTLFDEATPIGSAPVSTGMPGHPTPLGVFTVIQKDRYHHSNIYSNAPMPYMQRITWSGVALHAGVLPGYPASHGCIRLPESFAIRLWNITQLGVRVIVTRNEVVPREISHPLLAALATPRPAPEPQAAASITMAAVTPAPVKEAEKTALDTKQPEARPADTKQPAAPSADAKPADAQKADMTAAGSKERGGTSLPSAALANDDPPGEATGEPAPVAPGVNPTPDSAQPASAASADAAPATPVPAPVAPAPATREPAAAAMAVEKRDEPRPVVGGFGADDQIPVPGLKPLKAVGNPGPISIFVSRKTGRLYVRKGFEPMFDMPVTIANKDAPLGTHVFTAGQPAPGGALHWIAMSMGSAQAAEPVKSRSRGGRDAKPSFLPEPAASSAAEALNRIEFPQEVINGIAPYMTSGASLMISDLGMSGETNKSTDFILVMR